MIANLLTGSPALAKACVDTCFQYALKLRTGDVIEFSGARIINPRWIHLEVQPMNWRSKHCNLSYLADRGVNVRIADIVWVMDAPEGS